MVFKSRYVFIRRNSYRIINTYLWSKIYRSQWKVVNFQSIFCCFSHSSSAIWSGNYIYQSRPKSIITGARTLLNAQIASTPRAYGVDCNYTYVSGNPSRYHSLNRSPDWVNWILILKRAEVTSVSGIWREGSSCYYLQYIVSRCRQGKGKMV